MEQCPVCGESIARARVVCGGCGQELPVRVVVIGECSWGPGFAVIAEQARTTDRKEGKDERCPNEG
jgi:hypothetical protein